MYDKYVERRGLNMNLMEMANHFKRIFNDNGDIRVYFAPGRVNLIGEHIDYNGGHVFPCALDVGTYMIARKRNDRKVRLYSFNNKRSGIMETSLDDLSYKKEDFWINYPKGVIWTFAKNGFLMDKGLDVFVYGNIPGSGLSSSASMEVCMANLLKDFYGFDIDNITIAKWCQYSENNYNKMNCGIMDQFASSMGKENNAIFLNCGDLSYRYVPLNLSGCTIIVSNSNKPHSLVSSHYNDRRIECENALAKLQKVVKIDSLCALSIADFEKYKYVINSENETKRAKHAVYEEQRTKDAIIALESNDIDRFGQLLNESGDSLRYDYDATCFEIDTLVSLARKQKGVYGSRETGGGWGGNTVSIVQNEYVEDFIKNVGESYYAITKLKPTFLKCHAGDGGRRLI